MVGGDTFDSSRLLAWCGERRLAVNLVRLFVEQVSVTLRGVDERLVVGDTAGVAALAHKLKGAAGQLTADSLSTIAGRMVEIALAGNVGQGRELLEQLRAEARSFVTAASQALGHSFDDALVSR
ncbi:MAG TPA: Hpt domain-containing protein [Planctomycetota bacterium]|nr:Hpt domain-containing protein [Planctomycetota bacterium]HRR78719.1 Hpt domain-containing protein [Planctomycetota bacterium]